MRNLTQHSNDSSSLPQLAALEPVLAIGLELASKSWVLCLSDGRQRSLLSVKDRDLEKVKSYVDQTKKKFGLPHDVRVIWVEEAGRDGFWVHRWLLEEGFESLVIDPASLAVPRRQRRRKTDRIDARRLCDELLRYLMGNKHAFSVLRVPDYEVQEQRRLVRERQRLVKERTALVNRMRSKLVENGCYEVTIDKTFRRRLPRLRGAGRNQPLSSYLIAELERTHQRWRLLQEQMAEVEAAIEGLAQTGVQLVKADPTGGQLNSADKVAFTCQMLRELRGVGLQAATLLSWEFFWRPFDKPKQTGPAAGLIPTPYNTGNSSREQGISKQGNRRVRAVIIETAWAWVRWQPNSSLTRWFNERYARGRGRSRKVGIVALARKLLGQFWSFVHRGVVPEGAILKYS